MVVAAVGREPNSGLVVSNDIFTVRHRERIISLAARNRVRAIYPFRFFAIDGGLIAYGTDLADLFRRSATCVDRILKGEHPRQIAGPVSRQIRADHQPEDRQGARPRRSAHASRPRRRGDRITLLLPVLARNCRSGMSA